MSRVLKLVSVLVLLFVVPVQAQQSGYHIDSALAGTWVRGGDTALGPVLTLRSDGHYVMRTIQTHRSFSGVTNVHVVTTGEWRVDGSTNSPARLCFEPIGALDMTCEGIAFVQGNRIAFGGEAEVGIVWQRVTEHDVPPQPPPVHRSSPVHHTRSQTTKSLSFALTHSQDSTLAKLDPVQVPSFPASAAGSRSPTPLPSPPDTQTYDGNQVGKSALAREDNPNPVYPSLLESAGVEGEVLVQFVIDTTGRVDMSTFKVLNTRSSVGSPEPRPESRQCVVGVDRIGPCPVDKKRAGEIQKAIQSADSLFAYSVQNVVPKIKFYPARLNGHKVKERVQVPFTFAKPHD